MKRSELPENKHSGDGIMHKNNIIKFISGGLTRPKGFRANGLACGLKRSGKTDLSLIVSDIPCAAAGVFTKNTVIAAPLQVTKQHLSNLTAQAIIANSGNANCFTGDCGLAYAKKMAEATALELQIKTRDVLVASTGIIGKPLPVTKILSGIPRLVQGLDTAATKAAMAVKGIMTTDTVIKECAVQFKLDSHTITLGGCAKGSGMIEPNMATMLGFLTSDVAIKPALLKQALRQACDRSFNRITVDGCMSTNDMVAILANGKAGNPMITVPDHHYEIFCEALIMLCRELAEQIVKDGEGAKKLLRISVSGAPNDAMAAKAAKAIANSNLVKTAAYGKNANWGRIAAAVGSLGLNVSEKTLKIKTETRSPKEIIITVDLGIGDAAGDALTCDLTWDYITLNNEYN